MKSPTSSRHLRPGTLAPILLTLTALAGACEGADDLVHDPSLSIVVQRVHLDGLCGPADETAEGATGDTTCWQLVQGSADWFEFADADYCTPTQLDPNDSAAYHSVQPGHSEYRVAARFDDDVIFDHFPDLRVATLIDGFAVGGVVTLAPRTGRTDAEVEGEPADDANDQELIAVERLPASTAGTLRFEIRGDHEPFPLSDPLELDTPQLEVAIEGADVALASGVGTATLCVEAPVGFPELSTYESTASGLPLQSGSLSLTKRAEGRRWGKLPIAVPAGDMGTWEVRAFVSELTAVAQATLRPPEGLQLAARREVEVDAVPSASPVGVTIGEPDSNCRNHRITIEGRDVVVGGTVSLSTNQGSWVGGSAGLDLRLLGDRTGEVQLLLPSVLTGNAVTLVATSSGVPSSSMTLDVLPIAAEGGFLYPPLGGTIPVDAEGSAPRTLQGRIEPPVGASFPASTKVEVRITSVQPAPNDPPCPDVITVPELTCDPATGEGLGCALLPPTLGVSTDGWFSVPIAGGLCFAGEITLKVYADQYQRDPAATYPCLADVPIATKAEIASVSLVFEP